MEVATHNDIWENFLKHHAIYRHSVELLLPAKADKITELEKNDKYGCAMARLYYRRVSDPLPDAGDVVGMSKYWKDFYNTIGGKGDDKKYVEKWNHVMEEK